LEKIEHPVIMKNMQETGSRWVLPLIKDTYENPTANIIVNDESS
jgi:hypothetical protein